MNIEDGTPYMPSNGTEGMEFEAEFCEYCIRLPISSGKQCPHLFKALCGEYNKRWIWKDGRPTCTAFRDRKQQRRKSVKRNKYQLDLF